MRASALEETQISQPSIPLRVLILEDSPHDVELMLCELQKTGVLLEHTVAGNAEEFRRAIREQTFDAVLSDCWLPDWTSVDALLELRAGWISLYYC